MRLDLAWTASTDNTGVQGYRIYRGGVLIATTGSTSYVDTGLSAATAYSYTVAAIDGAGNASAQSSAANGTTTAGGPAPVKTTTYAYDLADRLTGITPQTGSAATFRLDALGRHRTKVAGGITDTYAYVVSSEVIARITPSTGASTSSIVDPSGARLAVSTSSGGFGWTLSDLHGNLAGYATASGSVISDALRYAPMARPSPRSAPASRLPSATRAASSCRAAVMPTCTTSCSGPMPPTSAPSDRAPVRRRRRLTTHHVE